MNKYGEMAPRCGFFHDFKKTEFLVKRWDSKEEDISSECKKIRLFNNSKEKLLRMCII